ncbi:S8 family serine peptidase [Hyalangium gracile]|uniref:S8 family serine peptidase n=1 Tax=Hyalangium gracile TaxID=394092 RepID=UPI001CCAB346|nr:S8 family serine peptidase [Hyalangium gracile]
MSTRVLGAVWLVAALACEGPGSEPEQQPEALRTDGVTHKVQLSAEQARQLEQSGANIQLIADYDAFKLVEVDEKAMAALPEGAEPRDDLNVILLNAGTIDTASAHGKSLRAMKPQRFAGRRLHLVQFAGPIKPEWVQQLEATGVKLVTYIPNNAYLVYGDEAALNGLRKHVAASRTLQWNGDYLDDYKLDPSIHKLQTPTYAIQLVKDEEANGPTLELIRARQSRDGTIGEALGYVNVVAYLTLKDLQEIAQRPDVLSIQPRSEPRKYDERQNMIISGHVAGNSPTGPGWLAWLATKGFTQAQFTASGFGVDVTDSGLDNGTATPNHFGFYVGGDVSNASRIVYNRIEGTGSTAAGCDGHGNLNAHIVGGYTNKTGAPFTDAAGYAYGLGVAPFVKMGGSVIFGPDWTTPDYEDLQSRAYRDGMRISTNSWGYTSGNTYNIDCQQYDALVRDAQPTGSAVPAAGNQQMVIVFAAGNNGPGANSVAPPGTAKNVFTVGASENVQAFGGADACLVGDNGADSLNDIIDFSGRGPASDGRKKPDIVAPGTHVSGGVAQDATQRANPPANPLGKALACFDASGVCGGPSNNFFPLGQQWYSASSGTSHSTPAVAGGAALVRQYFINQGVAPPSAAMTKAYLMNTTRYLTGVDANDNLWSNKQGMGLMDLGMAFDGISRLLDDENPARLFTSTGQTHTFTGAISDPTKPFRVTLAWTDAPGSTTGSAWKNNLDLTVRIGTNTYKGNVFTGANSVTGGAADTQNNVESVFLPAGTTGNFSITVTAANINSDGVPGNASSLDQDFALVAYNSCNTLAPVPTGVGAAASGNNRIDLTWTASSGAVSYNIYRSTTAGGPYTQVATVTAPSYSDTTVSGGLTYYYVVRSVQCAESANSTEVSATATGACTLPPAFAGLTSVTNAGASTCANTLTWAAATPACGGTLSYSVYRGTTAGFTPSVDNRVAAGITGTTYSDDLNLTNGTRYYYVVRATEQGSATTEETNTVERSAVPTGTVSPGVRYFDDLDANRPANAASYWIATPTNASNIVTGCHYQSATRAYRMGPTSTVCTAQYATGLQATLSLGGNGTTSGINGFTLPASTLGPQMTFNLWYQFESLYDGAWLVYSTTSATGPWTNVGDAVSTTAPYISAGGYDGVLDGSSPAVRIWTGANSGANGSLKPVTVNLSSLAGQKVWFGFKLSSDVSVTGEGIYIDDVRITADAYGTCSTRTPPAGAPETYRVSGLPATVQAGAATSFTVTAVDAAGSTATSYSGTATLTSTDPQAVLPATLSFTAGVATGSVTFRTLGSQTLTATDTTLTGSASTSVTAGAATALTFTVQPANTVAGVSIAPAVRVGLVDAFGNSVTTGTNSVTLALGNNPSGGTLTGTTTATMSAGVATFSNLSLSKAGTGYTLVATATGLTSATSQAFDITPAAAAKLAFVTQPPNGYEGLPLNPAVQVAIQDAFGNATTSTANVTVALGNNPTSAVLAGTTTVAAVNGVATFSTLSVNKTGTGYTLNVTSTGLTSATSSAFNIAGSVGLPYRVGITRQPSNTVAGAVIAPSVQVAIYDQSGAVVAGATNAIALSLGSNPSGGTLSGTTVVNAVNGVATFDTLSVDRAGRNYTLVAGSSGLYADVSVVFDVGVGAPAQLAFTASPTGNVGSGSAFTVKVAVRDAGGNLVTGATAPVSLTLTSATGATLSGTTVATPVNGVATFTGLSVDKAGSGYVLGASATGLLSATSPAFGVEPGAPAALAFATEPSNTPSGAAITPAVRVEVKDAQGNTVTSSGALVTLALGTNPSGGTLGGTKAAVAINGVATFADLTVDKAGTGYSLRASSGAFTATSASFNVATGPAARLVFSAAPANAAAGAVLGPVTVRIEDSAGNVSTGSTAQVTLTLGGPAGGTLGGTTTVAAVNGVATFGDLFIQKAATGYTVTAGSTGLTSITSGAFDIAPAAAAKLAFSAQPSNTAAGATIAPAVKVSILDAFGNLVPSATSSVTLALEANPSGGTLSGTTTAAAVNGVATFANLTVDKAGTGYSLRASSGAFTATSASFNVATGPAARLVFSAAPANAAAGAVLGPVTVRIEDSAGNVSTGSTAQVTLTLGGPAGGTLGGTTTVAAVNGVATFGDLFIQKAATGYTVTAGSTGLTSITSGAFDIAPAAAAKLAFSAQPSNTAAGATIAPAVKVSILDAFGNLVPSATSSVTLALEANPSGGTLSGTTTAAAVNGVATFDTLSISRAGTGYQLTATSGTLTSATSTAFNAQAGVAARLVFTMAPSSTTAGANLGTVSVELQDAHGNRVSSASGITLTLQGGQGGTLSGTTTVAASGGVATFSDLSIARAGTGYQLKAQASGVTEATSAAFDIAHGPAAAVVFTVQPGSAQAGTAISPAVRVALQDAFGNVATNATEAITVALGNNPRNGTLSGTKTVNAINGVATFADLSINRKGQGYTLQATAGALPAATSAAFDITQGRGPKLVLRATLAQMTAGDALPSIEVELQDELGNVFTEATTSVTLGLGENPTGAQLLGTLAVPVVNGVAKFDGLSVRKVGNGYTLVASAPGFAGVTSQAFSVKPGAAASYTLALAPSVTAGQEASLSATAYDAYGNQAASYGGTVKVTSSDTAASFASTATFVEGVLSGFKVTFKSPGLRTLTVTDAENASLTGTAQLNVTPFAQPTATVTEPAGGTTVSGQVSITVTGAVASGTTLAQLSILVDGVVVASGTEATLTGTWDSTKAQDDTTHTITALVIDGAGNVAHSAPVSFTVHNGGGGCGCGTTSGTDAGIYFGLLLLARYVLGRRRAKAAAAA